MNDVADIVGQMLVELQLADKKHGSMKSHQEGISIIREEYLELEKEVYWGDQKKGMDEAIQLGAMAIKFIRDCIHINVKPEGGFPIIAD